MHYVGFVDPEDMNVVLGKRKYTSVTGYAGSKLAQVLLEISFCYMCILIDKLKPELFS